MRGLEARSNDLRIVKGECRVSGQSWSRVSRRWCREPLEMSYLSEQTNEEFRRS